jgi:hypothetical protein
MRTLTLKITAKDIAQGIRNNSWKCAAALAIRRHKGFEAANICGMSSSSNAVIDRDGKPDIPLPLDLYSYIDRFDYGKTVKPKTFKIKI